MNLKNIVLLSLVAVASSSNAKFSFKAGAFGGLAIQRAKIATFAPNTELFAGIKADKDRKGFFAAAFIDTTMDKKCLDFGVAVNLFYSNAKPKKLNAGAAAAGDPLFDIQLKNRGIMLAVGPKIGLNKGKFALGAGVSLTLAGYKFITTDTPAGAAAITTEFKSKMFRTLGAMPWVRAGYKLGDAEVFALVGHNFSKKPNLKRTSAASPVADAVFGLEVYNAAVNGVKPIKTSGTYFGVGAAIKIA